MRAISLLLLTGCAFATGSCASMGDAETSGLISPYEAIQSAATAAPGSISGQFAIRVQGVGRQDGNVYLNSETDYRDQRNLTIAILPSAIGPLARLYGSEADIFLLGKNIVVTGEARRTRILFTDNGRPTGKYYFQTHVRVSDPNQISVVSSRP